MTSNNVFVQNLNSMTGKMEWKCQPDDYDYQQEVARAAFADMLHDSERVRNQYQSLKLEPIIAVFPRTNSIFED